MTKTSSLLVLTGVLCAWQAVAKDLTDIEALASTPTRCVYGYTFDMYGADCAGLKLKTIPSLSGSIEVLNFNENKLREIDSDTLSYYTSMKFLYLRDNHINMIHNDAFARLTSLHTLDLAGNDIRELPMFIFQLSSLRKLYLGGNPLTLKNSSTQAERIKAPLEFVDMSDCKIQKLPDWGVMPQLMSYNISQNPLRHLNASHFAAMCNLQIVDLTGSLGRIQLCDMAPAIRWLQERHVVIQLEDYSKLNPEELDKCPETSNKLKETLNSTYRVCKNEFTQRLRFFSNTFYCEGSESKYSGLYITQGGCAIWLNDRVLICENPYVAPARGYRRTWLTVGGGLLGFLVCFVLLLYVLHRINVVKTKGRAAAKVKEVQMDGDEKAGAKLLNESPL